MLALRVKIAFCAAVFLLIVGFGAAFYRQMDHERPPMPSLSPGGGYRLFQLKDYAGFNQKKAPYIPYMPREYVKIVQEKKNPIK